MAKTSKQADVYRDLALAHYEAMARLGRTLGQSARLRLLDLLRQGPYSVESLAGQAGLTVANTSQHLQQMRAAGLVSTEKDGPRVIYRLSHPQVSALFSALRDLTEIVMPELDRIKEGLQVANEAEREALLAKIRAKAVTLIDVRPVEEYRAGHVAGALSLPLAEIPTRLAEIPAGVKLIAYCRGPYCPMALRAVHMLRNAGFEAEHLDLGAPELAARRFKLVVDNDSEDRRK